MGFFWQGLPPYIIRWSRDLLPSPVVAVETGTFQGDTSALLADAFGNCRTIERSSNLARSAQLRFADDPRVRVVEGSSRERLSECLPDMESSCFLWLDAHGVYDFDGADPEENPLLFEIETVLAQRRSAPTVIAIDDARGMGTQPDWPALADVFAALASGGFTGAIVDDCLVAAPSDLSPDFYRLYQMSRMVQVSALFHVWPQVRALTRTRAVTDAAITSAKRIVGR